MNVFAEEFLQLIFFFCKKRKNAKKDHKTCFARVSMCLLLSDWRSAPSRQAAASLVCRLSTRFIPRSTIGKETTCFCVAPLVAAPAEVTTLSSPRLRLSSGGLDCTSSSLNVSVCFFLKGLSVYDERQKTKNRIYFSLYLIFIIDEKLP